MPKYILSDIKLTKTTKNGHILHRIQCTQNFTTVDGTDIFEGELGGWIESEKNLSQNGACWVLQDGMVYEDAYVSENAQVYGNACVNGHAQVYGNACVYGNAHIMDYAQVYGDALISNNASVLSRAKVYGVSSIEGEAWIWGNCQVFDHSIIGKNAWIEGNAMIGNTNNVKDFFVGYDSEYTSKNHFSHIILMGDCCDEKQMQDRYGFIR